MYTASHTTSASGAFRGLARPSFACAHGPAGIHAMTVGAWQVTAIPSNDVVSTDHKLRIRRPEEVASQH